MGNLDNDFLLHVGCFESNSFINVLHTDYNDDDVYQPQIITHSPYYDTNNSNNSNTK